MNGFSEAVSLDKTTTEHGLIRPLMTALPGSRQVADDSGSLAPDFAVLVTAFLVESALAPTTIGSSSAPFPSRMP